MDLTLYMAFNTLICIILFGLSESSKITLFRDFILEAIKFKEQIKPFSATLTSNNFPSRSLNKVILDDSNKPNIKCITCHL